MNKEEYQLYEPFYEKLVESYPQLLLSNYHFQFALPPIQLQCNEIGGEEFEKITDIYGKNEIPFFGNNINSLSKRYATGINDLLWNEPVSLKECLIPSVDDLNSCFEQSDSTSLIKLDQNWQKDLKTWKSKSTFDFEETFHSEEWEKDPIEIKLGNEKYPLGQQMNRNEYSFTIKIKNMGLYQINREWLKEELLKKMLYWWDEKQMLITESVLIIQDIQMELVLHSHSLLRMASCKNAIDLSGELYFLGMPIKVKGNRRLRMAAMEYDSSVQVLGVLSKIIQREET